MATFPSNFSIRAGDVLTANEEYICHQANCVTKGVAGLAKLIFRRFPTADTYSGRQSPDTPGTIQVRGRIINMMAQYYPNLARKEGEFDSVSLRLKWFSECLTLIASLKPNSLAFPYGIGCGLAGGNWNLYQDMLINFTRQNPTIQVCLYQL